MVEVKVYNQSGEVVKTVKVPAKLFAAKAKPQLLREVVTILMANKRQVLAHTKDRSEVRGGGKKPWKQKGTGRARHGSSRSPIWRHGGVTFGPRKDRNFSLKLNEKVKQSALRMVISNKLEANYLLVVDKIDINEPKTKLLTKVISSLVKDDKKVLLALDKKNDNVVRAAKNMKKLSTIPANSLNVLDLLKSQYLLLTESALEKIIKLYA